MSSVITDLPVVTAIHPEGLAGASGLCVGDHIVSVQGVVPRDLIEWQNLTSEYPIELEVLRDGMTLSITIDTEIGQTEPRPLGVDVNSAVFDRVQTCDNHCEFCFIYQLPKGMRRSLYLKDDDYRLSFLFGNFTTLTRFTEADFERVITQRLSPLYVSVHATDPQSRSEMLRNERGGVSLRWMKLLIEQGIDVRAQIVLCPGVNDGDTLENTLATLMEEVPALTSIAIVPLGLSKHNTETRMRVHTKEEARQALSIIHKWQKRYLDTLGHSVVHAGDELYLVAEQPLPDADMYGGFEMLEDGIGLARQFCDSFTSPLKKQDHKLNRDSGFFSAVDRDVLLHGATNPTDYINAMNPAQDSSLRAARGMPDSPDVRSQGVAVQLSPSRRATSLGIITGRYGAMLIRPLLEKHQIGHVVVYEIENRYFGGNTAVAGLITFADIVEQLADAPKDRLYLLADVCLNNGRFLDGATIEDLKEHFNVRVIPSNGAALRKQIDMFSGTDASVSPVTAGTMEDHHGS